MAVVVLSHQGQSLDGFLRPVDVQVGHSAEIEGLVAFGVGVEVLLEEGDGCWEVALLVVGLLGLLENRVAVGRGVQGLAVLEGLGGAMGSRKHQGFVLAVGFEYHHYLYY